MVLSSCKKGGCLNLPNQKAGWIIFTFVIVFIISVVVLLVRPPTWLIDLGGTPGSANYTLTVVGFSALFGLIAALIALVVLSIPAVSGKLKS